MDAARPSILWGAGLVALVFSGCSGKECEDRRDCAAGEECSDEGTCFVPDIPRQPPRPLADAGPLPLDTGVIGPQDGGPQDGGVVGMDGGNPLIDGGLRDAGAVVLPGSRGLVWAAELDFSTGPRFRIFGELVDESTLTIDREGSMSLPDQEGGTCELKVRRTSGARTGYEADSILAIGGPTPGASFGMSPVGNGRFEPGGPPPPRMYSQSTRAQFQIIESDDPLSVETLYATVDAPRQITLTNPNEGTTIVIAQGFGFGWVPVTTMEPFTVELYDRDREVVLTCKTRDDGGYRVQPDAVAAFMAASPTIPYNIEIRRDREITLNARVGGMGGPSFPVTFRASWGVRFQAQ